MVRDNWKVTEDGLWIAKTIKGYRVGFSPELFANLGNIRYLELLTTGELEKGDPLLLVETLKAVHEISVPISGEVVAINSKVMEAPEQITEQAWIIRMDHVNEGEYQRLANYNNLDSENRLKWA